MQQSTDKLLNAMKAFFLPVRKRPGKNTTEASSAFARLFEKDQFKRFTISPFSKVFVTETVERPNKGQQA